MELDTSTQVGGPVRGLFHASTERMNVKNLVKQSFSDFGEDQALRLSAALAYYAAFSIPSLLLIIIGIIGLVYSGDVAGKVQEQIALLIGEGAAEALMAGAQKDTQYSGLAATIFGVAVLLFGASGVFGQLQDAMNTIWEVKPKPGRGFFGLIKERFLSFTMVLGTVFLLLISLVVSTVVSAFAGALPGGEALGYTIELALSFIVISFMFALIFKYVPDVKIGWRDVWVGAVVTGALFTIGKFLIGFYLGRSDMASQYGAAGPLLIILAWVYYSSAILFVGAEFTQVYANQYGSRVQPDEDAEPVTEEARAQEGLGPRKTEPEERARKEPAERPARIGKPVRPPAAVGAGWIGIASLAIGFLVGRRRAS